MRLQNGRKIQIPKWDLIIAHPPCTYLSSVATRQHSARMTAENRIEGRTIQRIRAMDFFMRCIQAPCEHIAVENPVGVMNTVFRKPDQIIDPYQFAESVDDTENYVTKRTCLWLKGLQPLAINHLTKPDNRSIWGVYTNEKSKCWEDTSTRDTGERSKTFPGIARAMAQQWGDYMMEVLA